MPVDVSRTPVPPVLYETAREVMASRGVPVELSRIRYVRPGVIEIDMTVRGVRALGDGD